MGRISWLVAACLGASLTGCGSDDTAATTTSAGTAGETTGSTPEPLDVHGFAGGCFSVHSDDLSLVRNAGGDGFEFVPAASEGAARFFMQPSDLAVYLLYDDERGYLVSDDGPLLRQTSLLSDVVLADDSYVSGAQWEVQLAAADPTRVQLVNRRTGNFLGTGGLTPNEVDAATVSLTPTDGCVAHPELSVDGGGTIERTRFDDGTLYGIADTHSHIMSNLAFGGGGIFHGGAFHPLGVEHALPDCAIYHGEGGRKDFFGFAFDTAGADGIDVAGLLPALLAGELDQDTHRTAGYPEFTDWPNGPSSSTHQTQYYRWLERAHLAGLRLVVQHATTNSVICNMIAGEGIQPVRYSCDDMVAVDRIIEETYAMERYIDAQNGGPGLGWFRIVDSPAQARQVIAGGKLAVILGIETSELFGCAVVQRPGSPICDEAYVIEQLDRIYELGVRVLFPVHKYDNAFSPGDGDRAFIEIGNFFNSGHWSNFTEDCPADIPVVFDKGDVAFGGLNMPRDDYTAPPPNDFSGFPENPLLTAFPFLEQIQEPPLVGDYCQNTGLTVVGETLIREMMARGMIIEIDHFSRRSYQRAFEMLEENDYPAAGTHGTNYDGRLYALGGISKTGLGRCREAQPGAMLRRLQERVALITQNGGYPAEGFGFDLNGFAGAPGPRFGEGRCPTEQTDPITYPFSSYGGDTVFTQPFVGNRAIDFNTEGMVHIGMLPELLQDARGDAVSDADLEPLFRSAEGYLRMWEKAEERATALGGG